MAINSSIEWTESTWNPVTGCSKISPGCTHCYAERMAKRLQAMGQKNYINGFEVTLHPDFLDLPLQWKKSQTIFVNSMSDLFHKKVPDEYVFKVFDVMNRANWHIYQILTKRAGRLDQLNAHINWSKHIWMGVTVESADYIHRIDHLRKTDAKTKFLSIEPLLGPIPNLNLEGIDWVIVGGESGPGARPIKQEWVIQIRDICLAAKVPFFFKQWGGYNKKKNGRELQGRTWSQRPHQAA